MTFEACRSSTNKRRSSVAKATALRGRNGAQRAHWFHDTSIVSVVWVIK